MLDRFEFLAGRIGSADAQALDVSELAELRAAMNVVRLREAAERLPAALEDPVAAALAAVAAHARGRMPPVEALMRLDAALARAMPEGGGPARDAALALSGLRRALFPEAPPPPEPGPEARRPPLEAAAA
jgi:hypothetical protein